MSEIKQVKDLIEMCKFSGVKTADIREDYEPIGQKLINELCESGDYIQRKITSNPFEGEWKIFKKEFDPYKRN